MKREKILRKGKTALIVILVLAVLLLAAGAGAYASLFSGRVQTPEAFCYQEAQFPGLSSKPVGFANSAGVPLAGRLYTAAETEPDGLLVFAHGMGYGHRAYLNVISFFANSGYAVFAYDATGYDDSGGKSARGVQQVLLDLDAALNAAEALPETTGLPVFLFGHSLGAYAASAVLSGHPEVRAAAALAGFNSTADLLRTRFGPAGILLTPGALLWERLCFGRAASNTSMKGFAASEAKVLIVHSSDDTEVPIACGLDLYEKVFGNDPRFTFLRMDGKGHRGLFTEDVPKTCLDLFNSCK